MKQALTTVVGTPELAVVDGIATVSSLEVARHFGKRHDDVLKAIRNLCEQLPADHLRNFAEMIRTFRVGKGATNTGLTYNITRDGFALLAMGFTGPKALAFKLAYIDAFNRMEAELSARYVAPLSNEKQFRNGMSMGLKFRMQGQAQKIMGKLMRSTYPPEQRFLHTQLRQVNAALGVPTESLEAMGLSAPADKLDAVIWSLDGTRHRPFTTLELAALQSLIDPEDTWVPWQLQGENDQDWRERIGNAVPSAAATAIAEVMGETLLLAHAGETFQLSARPVWVRPVALALSVRTWP